MRKLGVGAFVVMAIGALIAANLLHMQFSAQVRSVRREVETNPLITRELGEPVTVDVWKTGGLKRYTLQNRDTEVITLKTDVTGSRGLAELQMSVQNNDDQGWAGTYEVRTTSTARLIQGSYVTEPVRVIGRGRFSADGAALPFEAEAAPAAP